MRIISFVVDGRAGYGLHVDSGIVDAGRQLEHRDLKSLIAAQELSRLRSLETSAADFGHDDVDYLPVIPNAPRVFCVGANYFEHIREAGREPPETPWIFLRHGASLCGHTQPLEKPPESESFDYEIEFCAVIGKPGRRVKQSNALQYVAGYTIFNDGSVREYQRQSPLWTPGKNFDRSGAVGPWIVPAGEVDPGFDLRMQTRLNDETLQDDVVNRWHFSLPEVIEYISTWTGLQPGDLISMGTPSGVGFARTPPLWMQPGDVVEMEIEGLGTLKNPIVAG